VIFNFLFDMDHLEVYTAAAELHKTFAETQYIVIGVVSRLRKEVRKMKMIIVAGKNNPDSREEKYDDEKK